MNKLNKIIEAQHPSLSTRAFIRDGGVSLLLGTIFIVGGLFDHLLLVRTLKPVPAE
jgi:hypothetical protein